MTSTQPRNFILKTCLDSIFSEDSYSRRLNTSSTGSANGGANSGGGNSSGAASNNGLGSGGHDFPGKVVDSYLFRGIIWRRVFFSDVIAITLQRYPTQNNFTFMYTKSADLYWATICWLLMRE